MIDTSMGNSLTEWLMLLIWGEILGQLIPLKYMIMSLAMEHYVHCYHTLRVIGTYLFSS